jgi:hypothetical protein
MSSSREAIIIITRTIPAAESELTAQVQSAAARAKRCGASGASGTSGASVYTSSATFVGHLTLLCLAALITYLSVPVVANMISPEQRMIASFSSFKIVNSYGAFGDVSRTRLQLVVEGTSSNDIGSNTTGR